MWNGSLDGNHVLVSMVLLCLAPFCALNPLQFGKQFPEREGLSIGFWKKTDFQDQKDLFLFYLFLMGKTDLIIQLYTNQLDLL